MVEHYQLPIIKRKEKIPFEINNTTRENAYSIWSKLCWIKIGKGKITYHNSLRFHLFSIAKDPFTLKIDQKSYIFLSECNDHLLVNKAVSVPKPWLGVGYFRKFSLGEVCYTNIKDTLTKFFLYRALEGRVLRFQGKAEPLR